MEHHLGLTCDPICGLVQIPCIERNAVAAMRAMNACNLSYFLTGSRNISYDMVCRAMKETGINLNHRFRETSEGGLAKIYNRRKNSSITQSPGSGQTGHRRVLFNLQYSPAVQSALSCILPSTVPTPVIPKKAPFPHSGSAKAHK